ncbi:unnamed protein product [Urochloa decumbens]|uniref:Uncharacterized protein n=1 Tax=Urochloa decumbens TaxID=240449 RepID=A0ABC9AES4_9POAL
MSRISLSVPDMLATLAGRHPPKLLCARTTTDAGEFPKLSGSWNRRRLWLRKMASRGLSKRRGGTGPSKSLNRRSRKRSAGRSRTTSGNGPTKRLLLRSSSWRMRRRRSVAGSTPQKRLELRWSSARSVRRPSSGGRNPAMSPWLRSTPATASAPRWGPEGSGAQKTPV